MRVSDSAIHVLFLSLMSLFLGQATFFAWANDALRYEEDSLRAVVIASMNCGSGAINAWQVECVTHFTITSLTHNGLGGRLCSIRQTSHQSSHGACGQ
jgi:hypothetical protein